MHQTQVRRNAYFHRARWGYVAGILLVVFFSQVMGVAQPALLYLVPCVLGPIVTRGYRLGHLKLLWSGPEPR